MLLCSNTKRIRQHLDVEFKVFIHGKDVVENVLGNARNDAHLVRVVQLALKQEITDAGITRSGMAIQEERKMVASCYNAFKYSENICSVKAKDSRRNERKIRKCYPGRKNHEESTKYRPIVKKNNNKKALMKDGLISVI